MARAFIRAPSGIVGLAIISFLAIVAIGGPPIFGASAVATNVAHASTNPSGAHLLGTDDLGRDILSRLIVATRLSLVEALAATGVGAIVGVLAGAFASVLEPRLRGIALRTVDALLAFPAILIAIFLASILGPGEASAELGVGIALSFYFARIVSALALSIGGSEYIASAKVLGVRRPRLLFRHVLPNIAETILISGAVAVSSSIVIVSSLSFLGLGVQPPSFDWGSMLTQGVQAIYITPVAALAPAVAVSISAVAFGFAGEALARASNPVLWTQTQRRPLWFRPSTNIHSVRTPIAAAGRVDGLAATDSPLVEVSDLRVTFPGRGGDPVPVVDGVSLRVQRAEMVGIVGESGSGKTMTAMAIAQLVPSPGVVTGSVRFMDNNLEGMAPKDRNSLLGTSLAVVLQDPMSSLNPALRIGRQLTEGVMSHQHRRHFEAVDLATARLAEVNIPAPRQYLRRYPYELSGGMRQRVLIAMGLMITPTLLIADEPTTALDVTIQAQVMDLLERINAEHGTAILLISHNLGLITLHCHRILVMYAGTVVEELTSDEVLAGPLHPYTVALLKSVPNMSTSTGMPLQSIPGQPPDPGDLVHGCPFHPRCPHAMQQCQTERPPLIERPDRRRVACWVANQEVT